METKQKKKFSMPHTFIIIGIILVFVTALTYIVPAGSYERYEDPVTGYMVIDSESFEFIEQTPVSPFGMFMAIGDGMVDSAQIIFFIFFAYGAVYMLIKTGTFFGGLAALVRILKGKQSLIIPIFMILFGIFGSTFGMYEEAYGLIPAFIGIAVAMGYDGLVGGSTVVIGIVTGFAAATLNPFTIGIAMQIAELPIGSGMWFRVLCFILFQALAIIYVMRYANKVRRDPKLSIVQDVDFNTGGGVSRSEMEKLPFTKKHMLIMLIFFAAIGVLVFCTTQYGWYLSELTALFLITMVIVGLVGGFSMSEICSHFIEATKEIVFGALVVGVARALTLVMTDGNIIDTIVFYASSALSQVPQSLASIGMVIVQNFINFFIPSGSGQAAVSMPLMVPLADNLGISRQVAVLAFQFGDGFSNMFWPTVVATECGIMGLPIQKWYKFIAPLFVMMLALQFILIAVATAIGF